MYVLQNFKVKKLIHECLNPNPFGGANLPPYLFFFFQKIIFQKIRPGSFCLFVFFVLFIILKKKWKKICGGVPTEDLSNESNEKSNVQKSLLSKKKSTKNNISRKTKYISFRAIFGGILPKEKILWPKLATGFPENVVLEKKECISETFDLLTSVSVENLRKVKKNSYGAAWPCA